MTDLRTTDEQPTDTTPARHKRWWLRILVGVVVAALLFELGARVLERWFIATPDGFNVPAIDGQLEAMDEVVAEGGAEVLVIGSSVANGVDPGLLDELSERYDGAFTFWSAGAGVRSTELLYQDLAAPTLDPEVVVLPLTSRELNALGDGLLRNYQALLSSPGLHVRTGGGTWLQQADRWAAERSALFRVRPTLRSPGRLYQALQAGQTTDDFRWWETWERPPVGWAQTADHEAQERRALESYRLEGPELEALERLTRTIRDEGRRVILVTMPVYTPEYDAFSQRGAADREAFEAAVAELCVELDVECFDASAAGFTRDDFANANHMNDVGTPRLTGVIAEALDAGA
jgi:hypothetical protein